MATKSRKFREDFDPGRMFVVQKLFTLSGKQQQVGATFAKGEVNVRRLRQLYDGRYLNMVAMGEAAPDQPAGTPVMPNFLTMSMPVLGEWLKAHGRVPHPRATHARLAQRAIRRWNELQEKPADGVPA